MLYLSKYFGSGLYVFWLDHKLGLTDTSISLLVDLLALLTLTSSDAWCENGPSKKSSGVADDVRWLCSSVLLSCDTDPVSDPKFEAS